MKPKRSQSLRTVDLFSGCGGLSLGFQNAGFEVVAGYENWNLAHEVYRSNFSHDAHLVDLSKVADAAKHISSYKPEVIIGGPPCQDFSIAGKRTELERADLTVAFAKIVTLVRPRVFVMENVYSIEKSEALRRAKNIFRRNGYGMTTRIIDASLIGVPQKRRRLFLVGAIDMNDEAFGLSLDSKLQQEPTTVFDVFGDSLGLEHYYAHPRSYNRRAVFSIYEPSSTIRRVNRPIPKNYVPHPADKARITQAVRPLTTAERAKIQSFPDSFTFLGSKSEQEHLIANAVPPRLGQYVGEQVAAIQGLAR